MLSSLPFTSQECFFVAILAFIVVGFQRGWRREIITLVFVLLAVVLIRPGSGNVFSQFIGRVFSSISYLIFGSQGNSSSSATSFLDGGLGTLFLFALVVVLGYVIGNRVFPRPASPVDRFLGVIPAVISGAFILYYLVNGGFFGKTAQGQSIFSVVVQPPDPSNYLSIIFIIAIIASIIAFAMSRGKKPAAKK
jgi:hypothetical protein